jgi:Protein of unknown function (DUF2958)
MTRTVPRMPPMYINFSDGNSQLALEHGRIGLSGRYRTQYGANSTHAAILDWDVLNFGYVSLTELRTVHGKLGLPVGRDLHFEADKPISASDRFTAALRNCVHPVLIGQ